MGIVLFVLIVQVGERWRSRLQDICNSEPGLVLELGPHLWLAVVVLLSVRNLLLLYRFFGRPLLCLTCAPALVFEDDKCRVCTIDMRQIEQRTVRKETYKWK